MALLSALAASADDSAEQKALRARRDSLLKAINAHDAKAVKGFFDPSFTAKLKSGESMSYDHAMQAIEQLFDKQKDFQEKATIEKIEVSGGTAHVTVSETDTLTDENGQKQMLTSCNRETWKRINGRWLSVSEEEL